MPPETTNYAKFQTGNPVVRRLIDRFYARVGAAVTPLAPEATLDAGCGEGETVARLGAALPGRVVALDLNPDAAAFAADRLGAKVETAVGSVEDLPYEDGEFDLVVCLEVLEHLPDPARAVAELARVGRGAVVVSVPHEPWFRLGSLLRGKYLAGLGNHPEHVNHWRAGSLRRLLQERLDVVSVEGAFPWLLARCRVRR